MERTIGDRIRALRLQRGLTLDGLAQASGVSRAMISRIERGETSPTAVLLARLCTALGSSLSAFFAEEGVAEPFVTRARQHVWQDPATGYVRRAISPPGTASGVDIVEVELPPGKSVSFPPQASSLGIWQHVWLLSGSLIMELPDGAFAMQPGDCLFHDIGRGHAFMNRTTQPARYAVVLEHKR